ncbi:hypothetical protein L8T89_01895 [Campylobacter lari]|nr:hypothetical protein [Campylobacter lari]
MIAESIYYSLIEALKSNKKEVFLNIKGILFPIYIDYKHKSKWLLLLPGAIDRNKKNIPLFQRSSYSAELDCNVICLFDPTLFFDKDISIGWFIGDTEYHYADILGEFLKINFDKMNVKMDNIYLYGSSAGGLPCLFLSSKLNGCRVMLYNIQTDILKYYRRFLIILYEKIFKKYQNFDIFVEKYFYRFRCDKLGDGNFYYIQNISDKFHYNNFFIPFREEMKENVLFYLFEDTKIKHGPLEKNIELKILNNYIFNTDCKNKFSDLKIFTELR